MDVSLILLRRPAPRYPSSYVQIPSHTHHFHNSENGGSSCFLGNIKVCTLISKHLGYLEALR